jgi:hypothetical protein
MKPFESFRSDPAHFHDVLDANERFHAPELDYRLSCFGSNPRQRFELDP